MVVSNFCDPFLSSQYYTIIKAYCHNFYDHLPEKLDTFMFLIFIDY